MPRSLLNRMWHDFVRYVARVIAVAVYCVRRRGQEFVPASGGGLLLSNHQSNFDPIFIGLATKRRLIYVARQTLFQFAPLGWLIHSIGSIAIDRDGTGLAGLKATLKRLKQGEVVVLFPEGTRTPDGELQQLKPGFIMIARRTRLPLFPVAIDGAFEAWPRQQWLPRPGVIHVQFGPPILPAEVERLNDEELIAEVARRISDCHEQARRTRLRAMGQ